MNLSEYNKVKDFTYLEYCDFLQKKYGKAKYDYFTASFNKNRNVTRTKEGLVAHHKYEDHMIMLSTPEIAKAFPFEWQQKENIIYCDYLEHLFLHVLVCEYPSPDKEPLARVGYGGVVNLIGPELNDLYSGWQTKQEWRKKCHDLVINDKEVYLTLLERFISRQEDTELEELTKSFNSTFGLWNTRNNETINREIADIYFRYHSNKKQEVQVKYKRIVDKLLSDYASGNIGAKTVLKWHFHTLFKAECNHLLNDDYSKDEIEYFPFSSKEEYDSINKRIYDLIVEKEDYDNASVCCWCIRNFGDAAVMKIPEKYFKIEWGYLLIDEYIHRVPEGTDMKELYGYYAKCDRNFAIEKIPEKYRDESMYLKHLLNSRSAKDFFKRYEMVPEECRNETLYRGIVKKTSFKRVRDFFTE